MIVHVLLRGQGAIGIQVDQELLNNPARIIENGLCCLPQGGGAVWYGRCCGDHTVPDWQANLHHHKFLLSLWHFQCDRDRHVQQKVLNERQLHTSYRSKGVGNGMFHWGKCRLKVARDR